MFPYTRFTSFRHDGSVEVQVAQAQLNTEGEICYYCYSKFVRTYAARCILSKWVAELAQGGDVATDAGRYLARAAQTTVKHTEIHGSPRWSPSFLAEFAAAELFGDCRDILGLPPAKHEELEDYKKGYGENDNQWRRYTEQMRDELVFLPGGILLVKLLTRDVWTKKGQIPPAGCQETTA